MSTGVTHRWRTEIIDGVEREIPTPKKLHIRIQNRIEQVMFRAVHQHPQFEMLPGLDTLLDRGRDFLCPDIVVTRSDAVYDPDNDMLHARDALLAVEILSPGQTVGELFGKCDLLHEAGCPVCWIIWGEKRRAWISEGVDLQLEVTEYGRLSAHTLPDEFCVNLEEVFQERRG